MSYQRWKNVETFKNGCIDVVQSWFNVVLMWDTDALSMLRNVENPTFDYVSFSTSDQRYFNNDPQCWNNVDLTLKLAGSIYEKVNTKEYSACNFTNILKLAGTSQGLC